MKRPSKKTGMALAMALCFIFLLMVLGVAFINTMGLKYKGSGDYETALRSFYASDSAYRIAIADLKNNLGNMPTYINDYGSHPIGGTIQNLGGSSVVTYRVYLDPNPPTFSSRPPSTPNPGSWIDPNDCTNYQICLCCEGKYTIGSTVMSVRTIGMQVLVTPSYGTNQVYVLRWYEKYK